MAKKSGGGYLGIGNQILNVILAIIPFTSWLLGAITRILNGHIIAGILQLIPPITLFFWITDIIGTILHNKLWFFA